MTVYTQKDFPFVYNDHFDERNIFPLYDGRSEEGWKDSKEFFEGWDRENELDKLGEEDELADFFLKNKGSFSYSV